MATHPQELARESEPSRDDQLQLYAKFFQGLANPVRLAIVEALLDGEKNVTELVEITQSPQGRVSSHLACLKWCGYVTTRQEGRRVYYQISDSRVRSLLENAHAIVADNAKRILACTRI